MAQEKKTLKKHLQMLRVFKSAHRQALSLGVSTIYEAHLLLRDENGLLYKVFRYFLPGQSLPELTYVFQDIYITVLTPETIKHYVEECDKYGIEG